jgi:hypothetical protein
MSSSLSQRDFLTTGDGLLTYDALTGREWLDLRFAPLGSYSGTYGVELADMLSGSGLAIDTFSVAADNSYFQRATFYEVEELISHAGVDTSIIGIVDWPNMYKADAGDLEPYADIANIEPMSKLFELLNTPGRYSHVSALGGVTAEGATYVLQYQEPGSASALVAIASSKYFNINDGLASDGAGALYDYSFWYKNGEPRTPRPNIAPTDINIEFMTLYENVANAVVGTISVVDSDKYDSYTLALTGSVGKSLFILEGHLLRLGPGVSADYETQSSYNVTVTATDSGGLSKSQPFTIKVTDVDETTLTDNGDNSTYSGDTTTQKTLYGSAGNDILDGFSGYDIIDGKGGLDTAKYSVASTEVSFSENYGSLVIQNSANSSLYSHTNAWVVESDTLVSMERIQFSDKNYALDLDGNASVAAKAVITCFGQDSLDLYMSAALTLADGGSTLDEICELVASMGYIESIKGISTNSAFVDFIFENVVGRAPNFLESSMYTTYLDDGAYTKGSFLTLAANTSLVDKLLTESAVDLIGVAGSADGEILALQYDIGLG